MARIIDGKNMNMIGSRLRTLRVERGWSQQTLSDKLEVLAIYICRGSVSRIEDKRRTVTDIELYGLSQVLGVPIESLFEDLPNEKSERGCGELRSPFLHQFPQLLRPVVLRLFQHMKGQSFLRGADFRAGKPHRHQIPGLQRQSGDDGRLGVLHRPP